MSNRLTIDIGNDEPGLGGSSLVPVGAYDAIIDDVEQTTPKNGDNVGKPMYRVTYKIETGPSAGRKATQTVCLWKGALISLFQLMEALDMEVTPGKLEVPTPKELIGKRVTVVIKHEAYNDEMTYKVGRVKARKGGGTGVASAASAGKRSGTKRVAFGTTTPESDSD